MDDRTEIPDVNADHAGARAAMIEWLVREAWRITSPQKLILEVCRRFVTAGMALRTFNVFIFTLHPDFVADFPVLDDYRDAGATDYVLIRMDFSDGSTHCITMTSHRPGGFSTAELCLVSDLLPYMARLAEVQATRFLATTLLDTFVGKDAGERILVGNIRRGSGESVRAVIWYCDLRDFTVLSDALTRDELIELLNDYFDCVGPPLRDLGEPIVISAAFARASGRDLRPLGRHALKGVAEPQDVFVPV